MFVKALKGPQPPSHFSLLEISLLLLLLFFGFYSRTLRVAFPKARVFDEVHFGGFANGYLNRSYFHDIHPPLGKLLLALAGHMEGYDGSIVFKGDEPYSSNHYVSLRMAPASLSAMIPAIAFVSMRLLGYSAIASLMSGLLLATENMLIVESRLVLIDGFLHFFTVLAIFATVWFRVKPSLIALVCVGVACGCTLSVKYTGASVFVFVGMSLLVTYSKCSWRYLFSKTSWALGDLMKMPVVGIAQRCLIVGVVGFAVLYATFVVHLLILIHDGSGAAFLPKKMRNRLFHEKLSPMRRFFLVISPSSVFTLMKAMHKSNMAIRNTHSAASRWYQWPLVYMSALTYYSNKYSLVLAANPFIWYPVALGPPASLALAIISYVIGNAPVTSLVIWPVGYYASLLPFALVPRVLFVYHYLVPLIFGVFSVTTFIDVLLSNQLRLRSCILTLWLIATLCSWMFFAPWCYAMTNTNWKIRTWYSGMFRRDEVKETPYPRKHSLLKKLLLLLEIFICA